MNRGPGLWQFDVSLLADTNFISQMKDFLETWEPPTELSDPQVIWEWLKFQIKDFVLKYHARNKSLRTQIIAELQAELQILCNRQDTGEEDLSIEIDSVK